MFKWKSPETAPKDGRHIIALISHKSAGVTVYAVEDIFWCENYEGKESWYDLSEKETLLGWADMPTETKEMTGGYLK